MTDNNHFDIDAETLEAVIRVLQTPQPRDDETELIDTELDLEDETYEQLREMSEHYGVSIDETIDRVVAAAYEYEQRRRAETKRLNEDFWKNPNPPR